MSRQARARLESLQEKERELLHTLAELDRDVAAATAARNASREARVAAQRELEAQHRQFAQMREFLADKPSPHVPAPARGEPKAPLSLMTWVLIAIPLLMALCHR
jgi:hypothetical protein